MRRFICSAVGHRPSAISQRIIAFAIVTAFAASSAASVKQRARPHTVTPANVHMGSLLLRTGRRPRVYPGTHGGDEGAHQRDRAHRSDSGGANVPQSLG